MKTILVTGATGGQGGSVACFLLKSGKFTVRCVTRKPDSPKAAELRKAGADVVAADLGDLPSLRAAMKDCYGVFGVTNFWEHFGRESEHGRNLVDAVATSGIQHFVFSTLPGAKKISNGELDVPHFDIKAELEAYARGFGLPATYVHVAFYYENFLTFFPPQKQLDGTYTFGFPQGDTPLAMVSVGDVGGVVASIFDRPQEFIGRTVGIVAEDDKPVACAEKMSRILGKSIHYQHVPREVFASYGFPGADDLANMFDFNRRFIPERRADMEESRRLYPEIQTFEAWLTANKAAFKLS